jgi:hypothetical protein
VALPQHPLQLPASARLRVNANTALVPAAAVAFRRRGIALPALLTASSRRLFNLQNRFNRFDFSVPIQRAVPLVLAARQAAVAAAIAYNATHLPHLTPASVPLYGLFQPRP